MSLIDGIFVKIKKRKKLVSVTWTAKGNGEKVMQENTSILKLTVEIWIV